MPLTCPTSRYALGVFALAGVFAAPASAELLAYEGFDYDRRQWFSVPVPIADIDGIGGLNGGSGFTEAWDDQSNTFTDAQGTRPVSGGIADISDPNDFAANPDVAGGRSPLSYTDQNNNGLVTTGNQYRGAFGNFNREFRTLDLPQPLGAPGTTAWFSFLAESFEGNSGSYSRVGLSDGKGNDGIFFGKINGTPDNWGVQIPTVRGDIDSGEAVMFLAKIDFRDATALEADQVSVWLNPADLTQDPSGTTPDIFVESSIDLILDTLQIHSRYSTDYDEFRLGTTFDAVTPSFVIPEPGSALVIGAGTLGLALRRRRHGC